MKIFGGYFQILKKKEETFVKMIKKYVNFFE